MAPKGVAEVKYATGIELRDEGQFGFLLPEDQASTGCHRRIQKPPVDSDLGCSVTLPGQ